MTKAAAKYLFATALLVLPLRAASSVPTAKPEDVGVSSERLQRISQMIQRRIAAGEMTGAVTIVARKGKIVHLEAQGVMDLDSKKPMAKDTMFRVASMTKPVTGLAIMMMIEEGKVRLNDPVSRYIPEFKRSESGGRPARAAGRGGSCSRAGCARRTRSRAEFLHGSRRARNHRQRSADPRIGAGQRHR